MAERLSDDNEGGFTIIEVLVAIFLLLVGVLGAVQMIDTANAVTDNTKAREGAVALGRQILEDARTVDYAHLDTTAAGNPLQTDLQSIVGGDDDGNPANGWQLNRRNVVYDVTLAACVFDDGSDGARYDNTGATYCAKSVAPTTPNPATDRNPDDFRRVEVDIKWNIGAQVPDCSHGGGQACVQQSELIANPSGGLGPSIANISPLYTGTTPGTWPGTDGTNNSVLATLAPDNGAIESGTTMGFNVTTSSPATSVAWSADDGVSQGLAAQPDTTDPIHWSVAWPYKKSGHDLSDGPHVVTFQAFVATLAGRPKTFTQAFNRFIPAGPATPAPAIGLDTRVTPIVELNWQPGNSDNDIHGYAAFQQAGTNPQLDNTNPIPLPGGTTDRVACPLNLNPTQLSCFDSSPPPNGTAKYYIAAFDTPWSLPTANPLIYSPTCVAGDPTCWPCPSMSASANVNLTISTPVVSTDRVGCPSATLSIDLNAPINPGPTWSFIVPPPPNPPNPPPPPCFVLTAPNAAGFPEVDWTNVNATDPDGILFYRVYRGAASDPTFDPTNPAYSFRYAVTTAKDFVDQSPGSGTNVYAVTAVDNTYQESPVVLDHC